MIPSAADSLLPGDVIQLYGVSELEFLEVLAQVPILDAAVAAEVEDFIKRFEAAAAHAGDGLECTKVAGFFNHGNASHLGIWFVGADARVSIGVRGEVGTLTALVALGVIEDGDAALLDGRKCFLVAPYQFVVRRLAR